MCIVTRQFARGFLFLVVTGIMLALSVAPLSAGDITGTVRFEGTAPKLTPLLMKADQSCAAQHKQPVNSEEVVVNQNGTLKNVFVYVKDGLGATKFNPPAVKAVMEQKGCVFLPHVLGLQVGQEFEFVNDDPCLHTAKASPKINTPFNLAEPMQGMKLTKKFGSAEIFFLQCSSHNWMNAYIGVFSNPFFAVTGDDGSFRIKGLPPGKYTIEVSQEKYGTQTIAVTVGATDVTGVEFKYKGH
jgi:plastocyanin